jgi:Ca-activated chloride channel homolog
VILGRFASLLTVAMAVAVLDAAPAAGPEPQAQFRSAVDVVSVTAVVTDRKGRLVRNLSQEDFQVYEGDQERPIVRFQSDDSGSLSLLLLVDGSGSMRLGSRLEGARGMAEQLLDLVEPGSDEAALFSFDADLREVQPFTTVPSQVVAALGHLESFGVTSLYDAIAEAARRLAARPTPRRAVVALTDGLDTTSRLTAGEVSGIASSLDVPVYVVVVTSPIDHPAARADEGQPRAGAQASLADLARWTGGQVFFVSTHLQASQTANEIVSELRHQYVFAFEAGGEPGWHPLEIRTRRAGHVVRARSGYIAGPTGAAESDVQMIR